MRHGEASARADTDSKRQLTDQGRQDILNMVERCRNDLSSVTEIWVSPYVRAKQTAQCVVDALGDGKPMDIKKWLTPSSNPAELMDALHQAADKTILVVTHQPLIGTVVDRYADLEIGRYRMGTAAIACIRSEVAAWGCGDLVWLHQP